MINGVLQIVSLVCCAIASWSSAWTKRRTQWLVSAVAMLVAFIALTIASSVVLNDPHNKGAAVVAT